MAVARAVKALRTFNSILAPAFVDPCCFPLPALAPQNFQSIFQYMNFTVTLIHIRFHSNNQITQCSRSDPFSGITRLSLASWLRKALTHSHPHRNSPSLSYETLHGCGENMSVPAVLGVSQLLIHEIWTRNTAHDHAYSSSTHVKLSWVSAKLLSLQVTASQGFLLSYIQRYWSDKGKQHKPFTDQRGNSVLLSSSCHFISTGLILGQRRNICFLGEQKRLKAEPVMRRDLSGESSEICRPWKRIKPILYLSRNYN